MTGIIQQTAVATGLEQGLVFALGISTIGILGVLLVLQRYTEHNIWDYLARIDGIGVIAIGTSLAVLYAFETRNFTVVRVFGTPLAALLLSAIAIGSDNLDTNAEIARWFTLGDGLRAVILGSSITIIYAVTTKGISNVTIGAYLAGFPVAGLLILVVVLFFPVRKAEEN